MTTYDPPQPRDWLICPQCKEEYCEKSVCPECGCDLVEDIEQMINENKDDKIEQVANYLCTDVIFHNKLGLDACHQSVKKWFLEQAETIVNMITDDTVGCEGITN